MQRVKVYQIRCQGRGMLPGIYHSAEQAEPDRVREDAETRRLFGETGIDGVPRWSRVVPVCMLMPDGIAGFEPWSEPEPAPDAGKSASSSSALPELAVSGVAHVSNP